MRTYVHTLEHIAFIYNYLQIIRMYNAHNLIYIMSYVCTYVHKIIYICIYVYTYIKLCDACGYLPMYGMYICHTAQTIIFMFTFHCTSSAEIFCFKDRMSMALESDGTAPFVVTRTGSATDRSCIGYTVGDVSTQGTYVPMYNTVLGNDVYNIMNVEALVAWVGLTLHGGHC